MGLLPATSTTCALAIILSLIGGALGGTEGDENPTTESNVPCHRATFRVIDENIPGPHSWLDWWTFEAYLKSPPFDIAEHPVIVAEVSAVPCARSGCCNSYFSFRPNTTDLQVFWQVFGDNFFKPLYGQLRGVRPRFILDAGANVGYSTILFSMMFPGVNIIAVEPNADNYRMLVFNTHRFPNVYPVNAGIWGKETYITLQEGKSELSGHWGHTFKETDSPPKGAEEEALRGVTITSLMDRFKFPRLDLAKVDIEGAEGIVFQESSDLRWLNSTRLVSVEAHDYKAHFYGLKKVLDVVWNAFLAREKSFSWFWEGEHTYFVRKEEAPLVEWTPPTHGGSGSSGGGSGGDDSVADGGDALNIRLAIAPNNRNWKHRLARYKSKPISIKDGHPKRVKRA